MFFTQTEELAVYINVNKSFSLESIQRDLKDTDIIILGPIFGKELIDSLQNAYDTASGNLNALTTAQKLIIERIQSISANFAISEWITSGQVQIDDGGVFILSTNERKTAFQWQIDSVVRKYQEKAYNAAEMALLFLRDNIIDYPEFEDSDQYVTLKQRFISNSRDFTKQFSQLRNNALIFESLKSCIDDVDSDFIKPILLANYYAELKNKMLNDSLTIADKNLLSIIQRAVVKLSVYKAINENSAIIDQNGFFTFNNTAGSDVRNGSQSASDSATEEMECLMLKDGKAQLTKIRSFLEENISDYPTYASDPNYVPGQSEQVQNASGQNHYRAL